MATAVAASPTKDKYPPEAFYVIGTEGAERFSYYGLTAIFTLHLKGPVIGLTPAQAVVWFSIFNACVYIAPLPGGWLSDRFFGRYKTILWVSFAYVLGHGILAVWPGPWGMLVGCAFIAFGAGGIKPCVSAFMGDQFRPEQQHLVERAYGWFYFSINVGSTIGVFLVPETYSRYGHAAAFAVPGVAMAVALLIYVMGRKLYRKLPPTGPNPNGFFAVVNYALSKAKPAPGQSRLEASAPPFPKDAVGGVQAALRIAFVFLLVSVFWALFFQYGSSWVLQAESMDLNVFGWVMSPGQLSLLNSVFVLSLIPVMNGIYKAAADRGREISALKKMTYGMYIASFAFLSALVLQVIVDKGNHPHALWQVFQYFFLSLAEVLISVTGLEFAYTQAPPSMKSVIMGMWFVCISLGSVLTAVVTKTFALVLGEPINWQLFYGFFFFLMLAAAVLFTFVARWYKPVKFEAA